MVHDQKIFIFYLEGMSSTTSGETSDSNLFSRTKGTVIVALLSLLVVLLGFALLKKFLFKRAVDPTIPISMQFVESGIDHIGMDKKH